MLTSWQQLSDDRRSIRLALYERVMALHDQGKSMKAIAAELSISKQTARKFVRAGAFPERAPKARGRTPLDVHRKYIEQRIAQGCQSSRLLARAPGTRLRRQSRSGQSLRRQAALAAAQTVTGPTRCAHDAVSLGQARLRMAGRLEASCRRRAEMRRPRALRAGTLRD